MARKKTHKGQGSPSVGTCHKRLKIKAEHRTFLDDQYPEFLKAKAKGGTSKRKNTKAWVRTKLIKELMGKFYGNVDSDDRKEVSDYMKEVSLPFLIVPFISDSYVD